MNPLKSLRQRYVELSEPYRLLLQLKAVTGGFSRSLLPECLREAGVQPPRGQVWNAGDIRTALHTLRQMGLILIVIFPCFLTYFYPTGHDVPEEVCQGHAVP